MVRRKASRRVPSVGAAFMFDDVEALRVARLVYRAGHLLDGPEWDGCRSRADRVLVRRLRRDVEAGRLRGAPKRWRAGVTVADVVECRLPDGAA